MYLENVYPHKRNTNVTVAGQMYRIGPGGFICGENDREPLDVPDEIASLMLQGKAWKKLSWDPSDPENESLFMQPLGATTAPEGVKGRPPRDMSMVDVNQRPQPIPRDQIPGQPIGGAVDREGTNLSGFEGTPPSDQHLAKSVNSDQNAEATYVAKDPEPGTTHASQAQTVAGDTPVGDGRPADSTPQWAEPSEGEYWPDPVPQMPKAFLKKMADAYDVKYAKNIGNEKLIKRINEAMYVEE